MTTKDKVARRKLSLLELATDLDNVSKACRIMGYSRQQFYEIRRNYQIYGADGLIDRLPGAKGPHPNRVSHSDIPFDDASCCIATNYCCFMSAHLSFSARLSA